MIESARHARMTEAIFGIGSLDNPHLCHPDVTRFLVTALNDLSVTLIRGAVDPRLCTILKKRWGCDGPPQSIAQIARDTGLSPTTVRQLEARACRAIRSRWNTSTLRKEVLRHEVLEVAYDNAAGWLRANVEKGSLRSYPNAPAVERCVLELAADLQSKAERLRRRYDD